MARYILCPRCELNFIDADEQEYCDVCVKELSGEKTFADDFEAEEAAEETVEESTEETSEEVAEEVSEEETDKNSEE